MVLCTVSTHAVAALRPTQPGIVAKQKRQGEALRRPLALPIIITSEAW